MFSDQEGGAVIDDGSEGKRVITSRDMAALFSPSDGDKDKEVVLLALREGESPSPHFENVKSSGIMSGYRLNPVMSLTGSIK